MTLYIDNSDLTFFLLTSLNNVLNAKGMPTAVTQSNRFSCLVMAHTVIQLSFKSK